MNLTVFFCQDNLYLSGFPDLSFLLLISFAFLFTIQVLNITSKQCFPLAVGLLVFSKAHKHRRLGLKDKLIWSVYLTDPEFVFQFLSSTSHPALISGQIVPLVSHPFSCLPSSVGQREISADGVPPSSVSSCALPFRVILPTLIPLLPLIFLVSKVLS